MSVRRTEYQAPWYSNVGDQIASAACSPPATSLREDSRCRRPDSCTQRWQSDPQQSTVPWRTAFRAPDSQHLGSIFSQIYMVTYSMLCSKVGELQISYKFVIAAMGRFLLDHSWIYAQSLSGYTVCLKIQTLVTWQSNFGLNYLLNFLNNYAHTLKQNCSPLIGL